MKKTFALIVLAALFTLSLTSTPALAGDLQRGRWQGVAIGLGVAALGHAILNHHVAVEAHPAPVYTYRHRPPVVRGHWEVRREWVPPERERVWNPGHYNRRGRWVPGHWTEIVTQPGYWREDKVWVAAR